MSSKERRGGAKSNRTRSTLNAGSPSSVQHVEKLRVCQKVIEQLCEDWPELKADEARKAKVHDLIVRLPRQYGLDAHHLEDIETHVTLLERASTKDAPVVHVREVLVGGDEESEKSFDADVEDEDDDFDADDVDADDVDADDETVDASPPFNVMAAPRTRRVHNGARGQLIILWTRLVISDPVPG